MLSRLSEMKEVVTLTPNKIDKRILCEFAVLLKEFERSFFADSVERRLFLMIIEKMLQSYWDSSNFRCLPQSNEINSIFEIILNSIGSMRFCHDDFWFGGRLEKKNQTTEQFSSHDISPAVRLNAVKYFSICVILLASVNSLDEKLGKIEVERVVQKLSESLCAENTVEVVNALMENDERVSMGSSLNPLVMFLLLIRDIDFDQQVVVDWLQSETVTIPFLLRFFKALSQLSKEETLQKFAVIDSSIQTELRTTNHGLSSNETLEEAMCSTFSFEIEELHGNQNVVRHVRIPVRNKLYYTRNDTPVKCTIREEQEPFEDSFTGFVIRLRLQLEKLGGLLPFNVKPITRVLLNVEETLEQ